MSFTSIAKRKKKVYMRGIFPNTKFGYLFKEPKENQ